MFVKILCVLCLCFYVQSKELSLEQVVVLSRHNVRTPLAKELSLISPNKWPHWNEKRGYLTAKGALLEGFLGEYFYQWLKEEGLLSHSCPDEKTFYVYSNLKQRTMASADAFAKKAFPHCNISINHGKDQSDPIFNPIIHNSSAVFKHKAIEEMQLLLKKLQLNSSYEVIEQILDYKNSEFCRKEGKCDLTIDKNMPVLVSYMKPNIKGPLKISKSAIDSFIMENYEGFPYKDVAWGQLINNQQWSSIIELSWNYHSIIFNIPIIAKDISKPLIEYISNFFLKNDSPKLTLIMGHDANMYTVLNSMGFKPYILEKQYEVVPAGGKIVFQKWHDRLKNIDLLKIEYVYLSTYQMRAGIPLSMAVPPKRTILELDSCKIDKQGFCPWKEFIDMLKNMYVN